MSNPSITGNAPLDTQTRISGGPVTARAGRFIARLAARCWRAYCRWDDRLRQRRHLRALDARLLADIGVSRTQARREASRWFFA